jgi:hypothetical protein
LNEFIEMEENNVEAITNWFKTYDLTCQTYSFEPNNIYNMNETGFSIGTS